LRRKIPVAVLSLLFGTLLAQEAQSASAEERYGELMNGQRKQNGSFTFELGILNGICCPHRFTGAPTSTGTQIQVPGNPVVTTLRVRVAGQKCLVTPASLTSANGDSTAL
jgi:hypothetical protein